MHPKIRLIYAWFTYWIDSQLLSYKMKRIYLILFVLIALPFATFAQNVNNHNVSGTIIDGENGEPLPIAAVQILSLPDSTQAKGVVTDMDGKFSATSVKNGKYVVRVSYIGYITSEIPLNITGKSARNIVMEDIELRSDANLLAETTITAEVPKVQAVKDTIMFNSAAYRLSEGASVQELIKKLPGVEVDGEGNITANGKTITKIMIDGKEFFLDDPNLATKNIPAKIVDKLRVVERKSEQAQFTGIDDGDEETVLDLGIKAGMMKGWFGNVGGGAGNPLVGGGDMKYEGAAMIGRFTDKSQISIIANGNNTNNRGFSDVAGNMMGQMRGGGGGGWTGRGITTSWMGGINANKNFKKEDSDIQGNLMYSGRDRLIEETKDRMTMLSPERTLYNHESGYDKTYSDGVRFGGEFDYKLTEKSSFMIRPSFNIGRGDFESFSEFNTRTNMDSTNKGYSKNYGDNNNHNIGTRLLWRQKFDRPGRTMSLSINLNFSNNESDGFNYSRTDFFKNNLIDSTAVVDQHFLSKSSTSTYAARLSYIEPLGKNYFVETAYRFTNKVTDSEKNTYSRDAGGAYSIFDPEYSTNYENTFFTQQAELNFMKQEEKYNISIGASVQPARTKSVGRGQDTSYTVTNFTPIARIDYRFSDSKQLRIRYRGRTSQPSINQLMPVNDNSDPLYRVEGNPDLKPEFTHSLSTNYQVNDRAKFSWFNMGLDMSYTQDDIVSKKYYTDEGVQISTYENTGKAVYSINGRVMYNAPIGKSNFTINTFTRAGYNNGISYVREQKDFVENETKNLNIFQMLRLTYRNDWAEIIAGGSVNYRNARYSVGSMEDVERWTNGINGSINFTIPGGINLKSDINHTFYKGFDEGYDEPVTVWNAEIAKTLFKNAATLKFKIYDILKQSRNTSVTTSENYIQNVTNNTLGQYFMVTLTWRFGNFGDMGKGGMRGGMRGPGMGRGPMGGPGRR